jgi:hypothetical protein
MQMEAPTTSEYIPGWHCQQSDSKTDGDDGEYFPEAHAVQNVDPNADEYVPIAQFLQTSKIAPRIPSPVLYWPLEHKEHAVEPVKLTNFPASHNLHVVALP